MMNTGKRKSLPHKEITIESEVFAMPVGKRIYLKRNMPDPEIMEQFKTIPASNTADVMERSCAMNPRIHLVSSPKAQMMVGPAYTVKCRAGDNLTLQAALNFCNEGDVLVSSDGQTFTEAAPAARYDFDPATGNRIRIDFASVEAAYVQVVFTLNTSSRTGGAQAAEIEVYE